MATKDGRAQIWYADGSGNVTGYTESVGEIASTIIDAYNEHFGTDIALWTPETKTLQVGSTLPNWSAYEKIEMSELEKVAVWLGSGYVIGQVSSNEYLLSTNQNNNNAAYMVGLDGLVYGEQDRSEGLDNYIISKISAEYPNVNQIVNDGTISYQMGETLGDWSEYEKIQ